MLGLTIRLIFLLLDILILFFLIFFIMFLWRHRGQVFRGDFSFFKDSFFYSMKKEIKDSELFRDEKELLKSKKHFLFKGISSIIFGLIIIIFVIRYLISGQIISFIDLFLLMLIYVGIKKIVKGIYNVFFLD